MEAGGLDAHWNTHYTNGVKYQRMNITLPQPVVKKLAKISNKSEFIAIALTERFKALEKDVFRRRLIEGYKEAARDRDDEKDAGADW